MILDNQKYRHWRIVFEDNTGGVDDEKEIIYAKKRDVYMTEKLSLPKDGYSVEVPGYYGKKVVWEVVDNPVVEDLKENGGIELQGFGFILFAKD